MQLLSIIDYFLTLSPYHIVNTLYLTNDDESRLDIMKVQAVLCEIQSGADFVDRILEKKCGDIITSTDKTTAWFATRINK